MDDRVPYARRAVEVLLPPFLHGSIISDVGGSYRHPQFRCFPRIRCTGNSEHVHVFDLTSIFRCQCRIVLDTSLVRRNMEKEIHPSI